MSELIIIGYNDPLPARQAQARVLELEHGFVVSLNGVAMVTVDHDGLTTVETPTCVGVTTAAGAVWGAVLGILFLMPGVGLQLGGALGAAMEKISRSGINDDFKARVQAMLRPGRAVVVLMAAKITENQFISAIQPFGGTLLQTSLSEEDEKELADDSGCDSRIIRT